VPTKPVTDLDAIDWLAPPVLALIVTVMGYLWGRTVRRGQGLSSIQWKMLTYSGVLMLGLGYAIILQDQLAALFHWRSAWIAVIIAWGILLATFGWFRHRKAVRAAPTSNANQSK
jgi:hypothetical protein